MRHVGLVITMLGLCVWPFHEGRAEGTWKAGAARVVITPTRPLWMAGYASRTRPAEGKVHDLCLRALVLEDAEGRRGTILSADVVGTSAAIHQRIAKRAEGHLKGGPLMLNSSHTHSGPVMSRTLEDIYPLDEDQRRWVGDYTTEFEDKAVAAIEEAVKNMQPVRLSAGIGKCDFAVNRRNNPEADVPKLRAENALKGPVDHSVPVLRVQREGGELVAVLFAYACHNTTIDFYQWCGDYAGYAQFSLEEKHPGAVCLFLMGCGGDQNPIPRRELKLAQEYGQRLAESVDRVLATSMRELAPSLRTATARVTCDFADPPAREELAKIAAGPADYRQRWAARLLRELEKGETWATNHDVPVHAWLLGDQLWVALGGEVVVDYALKFKGMLGEETWVTAYADDVMAYIPSKRVLQEGGYEGTSSMVAYGMPTYRWADDIEDRLSAAVEVLAKRVRGKSLRD